MMKVLNNRSSIVARLSNRLKDLLFVKPFLPYWRKELNGKLMIYLYHRIGEKGEHDYLDKGGSPVTSTAEFESDLLFLKQQGARFIRVCDINEEIFDERSFNVVVSIDDGFASNYTTGLEILTRLSIPSTIFQCSTMLNSNTLIWEHQLYWLYYGAYSNQFRDFIKRKKPDWPDACSDIRETIHPNIISQIIENFLQRHKGLKSLMKQQAKALYPSIKQLQRAERLGHEIASHGAEHLKRSNINDNEFKEELKVSYKQLSDIASQPLVSFSYPFNSYQTGDNKLCSELYDFIATVDGGAITQSLDVYALPRNTWPGVAKNNLRHRRWLLTGKV